MKKHLSESNDEKWPERPRVYPELMTPTALADGSEGFTPCPELLTEDELILFLRIPKVSKAKDYHNVIEHLKRIRGLPRIHICRKALYPKKAILKWVEKETGAGK